MHADVEDRTDVRMVQRRRGARFKRKAGESIRIGRGADRQDFDGDVAFEPGVAGLVDLAHAARAEQRVDAIGPEDGAGHESRLVVCERIPDTGGAFVALQQGVDVRAQRGIVPARISR